MDGVLRVDRRIEARSGGSTDAMGPLEGERSGTGQLVIIGDGIGTSLVVVAVLDDDSPIVSSVFNDGAKISTNSVVSACHLKQKKLTLWFDLTGRWDREGISSRWCIK